MARGESCLESWSETGLNRGLAYLRAMAVSGRETELSRPSDRGKFTLIVGCDPEVAAVVSSDGIILTD